MKSNRLVPFLRRLVWSSLLACAPVAGAADYYVSTGGNDAGGGTFGQPFRTIQRAAQVLAAGDTCYIRAGIYRETITPANSGTAASPITYRPYASEAVVISGVEVVSGWTVHTGNIYKAPVATVLGDKDQVFVDGRMMNLARWPNTTLDVSRPVKAVSTAGSYNPTVNGDGTYTGTYTDPVLTQAAGFFNGARIHALIGPTWVAQTGVITDYQPGVINFHFYKRSSNNYLPVANDPYFIFGSLALLDLPGEWYIDGGTKTLYLWPPQNDAPASHLVEVKRRDFGFELSSRAYINVQGLTFFACAINSSASSDHLTLDSLSCRYLSHYAFSEAISGSGFDPHMEDSGIILNGSFHTLRNSHLAFSAGNAVTLLGNHHLVENCTIHDVDYLEVDCAAINTGTATSVSSDHELRYNTCYNSGRGLLLLRALIRGSVHHNDLYRSMLRTTDGGAIYTFNHDGQNTEIAYNRIHDHIAPDNGAVGVYLDGGISNYRVHHNLIYNTWYGIEYNVNCLNILWYNNTSVGFKRSFFGGVSGTQTGTELRNNILTSTVNTYTGLTQSNNLLPGTDPLFVSPATFEYRIQAASPAREGGTVLPPYTDGYAESLPDIGAFEYGQTPWVAGSNLAINPPAAPVNLTAVANAAGTQLTWINSSSDESALVIERSADNRTYNELVRLPAHTTSYLDGANKRGYSFYYRVRAEESAFSNYAVAPSHDAFSVIEGELYDAQSGSITVNTIAPIAIGHCDAGQWVKYTGSNFGSGATQINLRVSSGSTAINNFIEVRLGSTTGTRIANINILGTGSYGTYIDLSAAITATTGTQDVVLLFKGGSGVCNLDYFSFTAASPVPLATSPGGISATTLSASQLQVGWTPPGGAEDGFKIERAADNQTFVEIGSTGPSGNSFVDSALPEGTTYYYRVRSFNAQGFSSYTTIAAATSLTLQQAWRKVYFGSTASIGNGADDADPDHDGLSNVVEYAFGLHPLNGASSSLPHPQVTGANFVTSFTQAAGISGVSYGAEWSPTLAAGSWMPVPDQGTGNAHVFSVALGAPKVFLRCIVTTSAGAVTTPPEGCLSSSLTAGGTTPLGLPLLNPPAFAGLSAAVTATTLRASGVTWTPDQFAQSATPYFALLLSGGQTGRALPILSNSADTLTLDVGAAPLTASPAASAFAAAAGDRFEVIPADTLASLFGDGSVASPLQLQGGPSSAAADLAQLYNGVKWIPYYFDTTAGRNFWVKLNGDGTSQNALALAPDTALLLKRQGGAASLAITGRAPLTPLATWLPGGTRAVALRFPADTTLGSLGFGSPGAWVANDLSFSADKINLFNGTKWVAYWKNLAGLWKKVGGDQSDQAGQLMPAGSCLLIQKLGSGADAASYFTQPLPYPAN